MDCVIRFHTARFDVTRERPNPINPIPGESLLLWLRETLAPRVDIPRPEPEDWGWFTGIDWRGRRYLLGASASEDDEGAGRREWVLQIVKNRSLSEKLLGKAKMTPDDECVRLILPLLEAQPDFEGVSLD